MQNYECGIKNAELRMQNVGGDGCGIKQLVEVQGASALDSADSAGSA